MTDTYQRSGMGLIAPDDFMTPVVPMEFEDEKKKKLPPLVDPAKIEQDTDFQVRAGVVGHKDVEPDDYAKSVKVAKDAGVHPDVVHVDRKAWEADKTNETNGTLATTNKFIKNWLLGNSANFQTSRDDLTTLDRMSRWMDAGWMVVKAANPVLGAGANLMKLPGVLPELKLATEDAINAYEAHNYGIASYKYQFGDLSVLPQLLAYEEKLKGRKESGSMWVTRTFAEFAGGMAASTPEAAKYGVGGAIVGAAVSGPALPIGAAGGAAAGLITGFALQSGMSTSGSVYRELDLMRDEQGRPLDENVKQVMALTAGFLVGSLEAAGGKLTKTAISELMKKMAGNVAIKEAISQKVISLARYGAKGAAINASQSLFEDMSKQIALIQQTEFEGKSFDQILNTPAERGKIFDKFLEAGAQGALLGTTLSIPAVIVPHQRHTKTDTLQVYANQNRLDQTMAIAAESKQRERNPEAFKDFVDGVEKETLSLPAELIIANKEAFRFIPNLDLQLQRAAETGTDISMTVGDYASNVPPELNAKITDHVRQGGKAQTPAEAMAMEEAQKQVAEQEKMQAEAKAKAEVPAEPSLAQKILSPEDAAKAEAAVQSVPDQIKISEPQQLTIPGLEQPIQLPEISVSSAAFKRLFTQRTPPPPIEVAIRAQNELRLRAGLNKIEAPPTPDTQLEFSLKPPEPHAFPPTPEPKPTLGPVSDEAVLIPKKRDAEATIARDALPKAEAEALFLQELKAQVRAIKTTEESIFELAIRRDPKTLEEFHKFIDEETKKVAEAKRVDAAETQKAQRHPDVAVVEGQDKATGQPTVTFRHPDGTLLISESKDKKGYRASMSVVAEDKRRQGIATQLYETAIEYAHNQGKPFYSSWATSEAAIGVWKSLEGVGWKVEQNPDAKKSGKGLAPPSSTGPDAWIFKIEPPTKKPVVSVEKIDTSNIHAAADAAYSSWLTKTTAVEGADVVRSLEDKDAQRAAYQTGEAIDRQRKLMWLQPLFESPKALGMTMKDFARYSKHIQEVQRKLTQAVWDAAHRVIKQKETKQWKEWAQEIGPEVEDAVARRPEIFIADYLTIGKVRFATEDRIPVFKLSAKDVDALFAREELAEMGVKEGENISDTLPGRMFIKDPKRQISADDLASMFQQGSGRYVIRMLMEAETIKAKNGENNTQRYTRLVKEGINERLTAEHGDLQQRILEQSIEAAVDVAQLNVLTDEWKALGKGLRIDDDAVRKSIIEDMGKMTIEDATQLERYQRQAGDWGLKAEQALLKNDPVGAFQAKQMQFMAFVRAQTAVEIKRDVASTGKIVRKYADRPRVESVDAQYNARILQFLQQSGVLIGRAREAADLQADVLKLTGPASLNEWIAEQQKRGEVISQPTFLLEMRGQAMESGTYNEMTVNQFRQFSKVLEDLDNVGSAKHYVQSAHARIQLETFIDNLTENLSHRLDSPERFRTDVESGSFRRRLRSMDAALIKVETLLTWLDANDPDGPMTQYFYRNFKESQAKYEAFEAKYSKMIKESLPHKVDLWGKTENTLLYDEYGNLMPIQRNEMFGIAGLFFGNEATRKRLLDTYGWNEADVNNFLWTNMTTLDDWDHLDTLFKINNEVDGMKSDVYRQLRGYGSAPLPGIEYVDRYGNVRKGGHWPMVDKDSWQYDRSQYGIVDREHYNPLPSETIMLETMRGIKRPSLDFSTLGYRMSEDLYDIAYRPSVVNALRLLEDGRVSKLIKDSYGKEYADMLERWVGDMANDQGWRDEMASRTWAGLARYIGATAITHLVGFSWATAAIHSTSAAANTVGELQRKSVQASFDVLGGKLGKTADWMFRNPRNTENATNFAWDNSPELRTRWIRDQNNLVKSLGHWSNLRTAQWHYQRWAQSFVAYTDYMTAVVAWHGMYHDAQEKGRSHEDSVFLADRLVRAAHGGVAMLDKAQIQRDVNLAPFTMFYGYFNHNYNQMRRFTKEVQGGTKESWQNLSDGEYRKIGERMSGPFWAGMFYMGAYVLVPALIHEMVRGKDDLEDQTLGGFMAKALVSQAAGTVPLMRDLVYAAMHPGVQSGIPMSQVFGAGAFASRAIKTISEGEAPKASDVLVLPLISYKFSSKYLLRLMDYMTDTEEDAPRDVREWKNVVLYGQPNQPGVKRKKKKGSTFVDPRY